MRAVVLALTLLGGCIEPAPEIQCGTLICPASSVCLPNGTCVTQDDAAACAGLDDGAACTTPVFTGTCRGGACMPPVCGDGFIEGSEQCDGPVTDTDCVEYGFDTGVPVCNNCVLDVINTCVRFGWHQIVGTTASNAWTDGTHFAVIARDNSGVYVTANRIPIGALNKPGYFFLAGNTHVIAAASLSELSLFDGTQFTQLDTTAILPAGANIQRIQVGGDNTIYVVVVTQAQSFVWAHSPSGAWTQIRSATLDDYQAFTVQDDQIVYAAKNGTGSKVLRWTGAAWAPTIVTTAEPIFEMTIAGTDLYVATATHVIAVVAGVQTTYTESTGELVALASGIYAGGGGGGSIDRLETAQWVEGINAPIQGHLFSDGTNLYIYGNGVYMYSGRQYAIRFSPSPVVDDLALLENGMPVASGLNQAMVPTLQNRISWTYTVLTFNAIAVAGVDENDYYVSDGSAIAHVTGGTATNVASVTNVRDMWMGGTTLYVVGNLQATYTLVGTTLTPLTPPAGTTGCNVTSVIGNATDVYATASCGTTDGGVWQLHGTTWSEIHHAPFRLVAIAIDPSNDLFTSGPDGGTHLIAGTWIDDVRAVGVSIAATSRSDIWIAGGPQAVIHYDGVSWSRLNVIGASHPRIVATAREVTITGVSQPVLLR